jgi:hypothetical protein
MGTASERWLALVVFVAGLLIIGLSASLRPDPRGFGTHEQLGLPPCGFRACTGIPCPTCGVTTSFAHFARGEVAPAFRAQPIGAVGFLVVCIATGLAGARLVLGKPRPGLIANLPWRIAASAFVLLWAAHWGMTIVKAVTHASGAR